MKTPNPLKNKRIEFHIIQSFPVSCLNRDDVGAPKTAVVGGQTRARVSSQCWKRAVRTKMHQYDEKLGIRTKHVEKCIFNACVLIGANEEQAKSCADTIAACIAEDTLHFFTETEINVFAEHAKSLDFDETKLKDKEIQKLAKKAFNPALDGLDIALFGRMVAKAAELNVEAAASFSHAISTHKVDNEVEYFTALDDLSEEPGAAHIGSLEFNSATYYRYISLDLGQLHETLMGERIEHAVELFTKALFEAVPSARQTTQSAASSWDFAKVLVRTGQRLQIPFETSIKAKDGGFLQPSIDELNKQLDRKEKLSGSLFGKIAEYTLGVDEGFSIDDLIVNLKQHAVGG